MKKMMKHGVVVLLAFPLLAGCSRPDADAMKSGLMKSGMPADQAECFAEKMKKGVKADPYNYMAELMNGGFSEKEAANKTRRKYGADFKAPMQEARDACVEE